MGILHTAFRSILGALTSKRGRLTEARNGAARLFWLIGDRSDQRAGDVVFVHGLWGDPRDTWKTGNGSSSWDEWLSQDRSDLGYWTFGYPVSPVAWTGTTMPLEDRAINALDILDADGLGQRPICFVVHSMGGLLVKQMLLASLTGIAGQYKHIGSLTCGIVFFATPHQGAVLASLLSYFRIILGATVAIEDLRAHEPKLRALNEWFRNNVHGLRIKVKVFYEMRETYGVWVVSPDSANPSVEGVSPVPVDASHLEISHPADKEFHTYKQTLKFLNEVLPISGDVKLRDGEGLLEQKAGVLRRALLGALKYGELERVYYDIKTFLTENPNYPEAERLFVDAQKALQHEVASRTPPFAAALRRPRLLYRPVTWTILFFLLALGGITSITGDLQRGVRNAAAYIKSVIHPNVPKPTPQFSFSVDPTDPAPGQPYVVRVRISSEEPGIIVRLIVLGTDGYSARVSGPTDRTGTYEFRVPGARPGVRDEISVEVLGLTSSERVIFVERKKGTTQ